MNQNLHFGKNKTFQFCLYLFILALSANLEAQTCTSDTTNQNSYGNGTWIGHVYDHNGNGNPVDSPFATYKGTTTEIETFDRNYTTGKPTCATGNDNFAIQYRMKKNFAAGNYTFTLSGDDGVRLSIDGGTKWLLTDWSDHGYQTSSVRVPMSGDYNLVLEYYEKSGGARVSFSYTFQATTDFLMPNANVTSFITTCSGTLYDSGGTYNYGNSENRAVIIKPAVAGAFVRIGATKLTVESNYPDYLTIYDGEGTGGAILYGGQTLSNGTGCKDFNIPEITSPSGALTVHFRSDAGKTCSGFALPISCFTPISCSGTPTGGTATLSSITGAALSAFTANVTGASTTAGLSYQWQIADSSTGPWADIPGATGATASLTAVPSPGTTKYYSRKVTCANGGASTNSTAVAFTTNSVTYCSPSSTTANTLYIDHFQFVGTLNDNPANTTGASGFSNFTNLTPVVRQPQGSVLNIVASAVGSDGKPNSGYWKAWVDFNGDGVFTNSNFLTGGEMVYSLTTLSTEALTFGFNIPSNTPVGKYRFRIRVGGGTGFGPCGNASIGETEDYVFEVIADCGAKIDTSTLSDVSRCGTGPVTLTAIGTGTGIKWYASATGGTAVHTGSSFTTNVTEKTSTTFYVVAYNDTCESAFRIPVTAIANPGPTVDFGSISSFCAATTEGQIISASNGKRTDILLNEPFNSLLGKFKQSATETGFLDIPDTFWMNQNSGYIPPSPPYEGLAPALSSGYTGRNFVMTNADYNRSGELLNRIELKDTEALNTKNFDNLILEFDLYYFTLVTASGPKNYFQVEYSIGGGGWQTLPNVLKRPNPDPGLPHIYDNQGNPNIWKRISIELPSTVLGKTGLKVRFTSYSYGSSTQTSFKESIAAIDNVKVYGIKDESSLFSWSSPQGGILYESNCTTLLGSTKTASVCVKPTANELESNSQFTLTASASFSNGCPATGTIVIANDLKVYDTTSSTVWNDAPNWKPGATVPTIDKCVLIKKPVSLTNGDGFAKNVVIAPAGSLTIQKDRTLTVADYVRNESTPLATNETNFIVESDGNLIQINSGMVNTGRMTAKREVSGLRYNPGSAVDYVYWSSPVAGQKTKNSTGSSLDGFSPGTANSNFFSYRESNDRFYETGDMTFTAGRGYAVQAERNHGLPYTKTYEFKGTPNNGDISFPIIKSADNPTGVVHGYNLVGNPYPSNINFNELHFGNPTLIWNTAWFWTNNVYTAQQMGSAYNGNNYAIYNGTGGVSATSPYNGSYKTPNGIIKVGQAFIVQAKSTGSLTFKNKYDDTRILRVNSTGDFYSKNSKQKNRFWISLLSPTNLSNSQLIAYVPGATDDFEKDYDAEALDTYSDLFYSVLTDKKLVIQGKSEAFSSDDKVLLGANFFQNGIYTISLDEAEGIFTERQIVYLKDKQEGVITNLYKGSYTFTATKGDNTGRFEIIYKPETVLATGNTKNQNIIVYRDSNNFVVKAQIKKISHLEVFDAAGRLIYSVTPNTLQVIIPAEKLLNSIYILKINQAGHTTTKKIIK